MPPKAATLLDHLLPWRKPKAESLLRPLDLRSALDQARTLGADRRVGTFLLPAIGEGRDIRLQRGDGVRPEPAPLQ